MKHAPFLAPQSRICHGLGQRLEPHNDPLFVLVSPFTTLSTHGVPYTANVVQRYVISVRSGLQLSLHCTFVLSLDILQRLAY
jgi:hypothetical protein